MRKILFCFAVVTILTRVYAQDEDLENYTDSPEVSKNVSCGQVLNTTSGSFSLRIHNLPDRECYWVIQPTNTTNHTAAVNLFFHLLFLHEEDVLTLHRNMKDAENDSHPLIEPIHAQNGSLAVITEEAVIVMKLKGSDISFNRKFEGKYHSPGCDFSVDPDLTIIHSPIQFINLTKPGECHFTYTRDPHQRAIPVFFFEEFNFTKSTVKLEGSTYPAGPYKNDPPIDFFLPPSPNDKTLTISVIYTDVKSSEYFRLRMRFVDSNCSGEFDVSDSNPIHLKSPVYIIDNGSLVMECRWVIKHPDSSKILGLALESLEFVNVYDMVAVNNGPSEISPPLLQITTSNRNLTLKQEIRTSAQFMWVSFKPDTYASAFSAHVTIQEQGGYHKGSGQVSMEKKSTGNDSVILLEVDNNEIVSLNFSGEVAPPGTLKIFDGFSYDNMLASLQGQIWYPVLSKGSRLMIVPENITSSFNVSFQGTNHSCLYMSTLSADSYILNGNCGKSCLWVIPPQSMPNYVMLLDLQHVSLKEGDQIEVYKTDSSKTHLGTVTAGMSYVPQIVVQADVGAIVNVTQSACKKVDETVVLIGHSSYVPGCDKMLSPGPSEMFQITSPLYPDTYPVFASCLWNVTVSGSILHLSFQSLKLAQNHCIKVTQNSNSYQFSGHQLPEDLFLNGDTSITFDSTNCNNKSDNSETLISEQGFVLNGTIADCGAILEGKRNGEFNTSMANKKKYCIWKIKVPANDDSTVNIISYTIAKTDDKKNFELHVYDGASVREPEIINSTKADIWSRTNTLIFIYKRLNISDPSSVFIIKYDTVGCNKTMLCENSICMHPDWRCNGVDECGDFTDERNCASVPIPPDVTLSGYSNVAFWMTALVMFVVGIILAIFVPYFYQKYKNGQYRRFGEISVIE